ncbi:SUMO ligase MMS21 [Aspergillus saccharolyticus JOP 1030-1]|uniref:SP-RING-type domain-containing protein n=1 Tax=Aspergillus saccharolyticus JOP 1030-1 TaxID=1450539 RepID=A0A318ZCI1_9EURO|nr:hypothetical protein BP01DRAFT_356987 [Aspergillus saccharolyticus JOP 1030-1]PYH45069.1 hypothetical protein BP01DRAFT_356987 [Aspergillus saccharolyticus JOP 1030-1]
MPLRHRAAHSQAPDPSSSATAIPQPPPYTPPTIPNPKPDQITLHSSSHTILVNLLASQSLRTLKTHLQHAQEKLTEAAGDINERLTDAEERARRKRERNASDSAGDAAAADEGKEDGAGGDDDEALSTLREKVQTMTSKLDQKMRGAIEGEVRLEALTDMLKELEGRVNVVDGAAGGRSTRTSRRSHRRDGDVDVEMEGDEEDQNENEEEEVVGPTLVGKVEESLAATKEQWSGLSLTQKYSTNNAYVGFYRIIHEAKHPGDDIPPLPHASTWFAHLEDGGKKPTTSARSRHTATSAASGVSAAVSASSSRLTGNSSAGGDDDEDASDEDIAIERERISLKCPLTLLPFKDPVTSTKCPHSFEREAITAMIAQSRTTAPDPRHTLGNTGRRARRVHCVQCPVCEVVLTEFDLRSDPVLVRRLKRAEAALRREQEELEEDEYDQGGSGGRRKRSRKSGITVASDDEDDTVTAHEAATQEDRIRIKQERGVSVAVVDVVEEESAEEEDEEAIEFEDGGHWQGGDDDEEVDEDEEDEDQEMS